MSYKKYFPIMESENFHYLDTGATSQKPISVINKVEEYYKNSNGNAGRGSHRLSIEAAEIVDKVREKVKTFINAKNLDEIIFVKNTTEALNLIAYSYGNTFLKEGDEILLGISNHHANIVPWQNVCKITGAKLRFIYLDENGQLDLDDFKSKVNCNTKVVSISAVVNATGVIQPFKEVIEYAKKNNIITILDAAQSILHFNHDVQSLGVDFLVFSGHKMFATMGVGILYGRREILDKMPPFLFGGDMIDYVEEQTTEFATLPNKFEAGTKDIGAIASLGAAIDFINEITYDKIKEHEDKILQYAYESLRNIGGIDIYYHENLDKAGVIAFNVSGVHSHDTAHILNEFGVMVRSGHHCAQPLMRYLGIASCCRASFAIYNTKEDIDALVIALKKVKEVFKI